MASLCRVVSDRACPRADSMAKKPLLSSATRIESEAEPEQSGEDKLEVRVSNRLKSRAKKIIRYLDLWHVRGYWELSDPAQLRLSGFERAGYLWSSY